MSARSQKGRVQGGWASQRPQRTSNQSDVKSSTTANQSEATSPDADIHKVPAWIGRDSDLPQSIVKFQQPDEQDIRADDVHTQLITEPGVYDLSSGPNGVARVKLFYNFLEEEFADRLYEELNERVPWEQKSDVKNGVRHLQPRVVAWYGDVGYSYSGVNHPPRPEWLPTLVQVRKLLEENSGVPFNSVLCNLYRDGKDHVSWHSDDEELFGRLPIIASISLGDTRIFELRKKDELGECNYKEYVRIPLPTRSLLLMEGATQLDWHHRIPMEYHDRGKRINLTYRNVVQ